VPDSWRVGQALKAAGVLHEERDFRGQAGWLVDAGWWDTTLVTYRARIGEGVHP
jgi:hypothetical protein